MDCTIAALIACFSWSGLYLDTSAQYLESNDRRYTESFYGDTLFVMPENGNDPYIQRTAVRQLDSPSRRIDNPYVTLALGYEINFSQVRVDASLFRQESVSSDDAENGVSLKVRWFPFRR